MYDPGMSTLEPPPDMDEGNNFTLVIPAPHERCERLII